jgi:hypothetical protein
MTALERVADFTNRQKPNQYCDDCLSVFLEILPRQQVQQKTHQLADEEHFARVLGACAQCSSIKLVLRAI